jgi:hypothetical protein
MMTWAALFLIPLCALLNHLGGQSTTIPDPRLTCRMLGQGIALGLVAFLSGVPAALAFQLVAVGVVGFVLWAVWAWGPGFAAVTGIARPGSDWCSKITQKIYPLPALATTSQCKWWGMVYMTIRGACLYPLFIALAFLLTPAALIIGLGCLLQGLAYRTVTEVMYAEWIYGIVIGTMLSWVLLTYL